MLRTKEAPSESDDDRDIPFGMGICPLEMDEVEEADAWRSFLLNLRGLPFLTAVALSVEDVDALRVILDSSPLSIGASFFRIFLFK